MQGVGMFMWRQPFRWGPITGLFLAGSAEGACTEKSLAKIWQERYFQNARKKGGSSRFWNGLMVFWAFPKQNSTLSRRKLIENWQTGMRNSFLEKVPHNSDLKEFICIKSMMCLSMWSTKGSSSL